MKQVYQADWERAREKFNNLNLLDAEALSKLDGFWEKRSQLILLPYQVS